MGYVGKINAGGSEHLVGSTLYGTCSTAAGTAAKVVTCSNFTTLIGGVTIHVKFTNTNTATSATLNVNATGAKPLCRYGTTRVGTTANSSWNAGAVVSFTYDGTSWVMNDYIADDLGFKTANILSTASEYYLTATNLAGGVESDTLYRTTAAKMTSNGTTSNIMSTTFNGYTLGAACEKSVGSVASGNTGLVTGGDVYTAIQSAAAGSLQYHGTATSDTDIGTSYKAGWYWIVGSAGGTIAGQAVEAGDMVLAHADYSGTLADDLDIVQSNVDRITNAEIDIIVAA